MLVGCCDCTMLCLRLVASIGKSWVLGSKLFEVWNLLGFGLKVHVEGIVHLPREETLVARCCLPVNFGASTVGF